MPDLIDPNVEYRSAPFHPVQPGQVWASNHKGDREAGTLQHREVEEVWSETHIRTEEIGLYAYLVTVDPDGTRRPRRRVKLNGKSVPGHRKVAEAGQDREGRR